MDSPFQSGIWLSISLALSLCVSPSAPQRPPIPYGVFHSLSRRMGNDDAVTRTDSSVQGDDKDNRSRPAIMLISCNGFNRVEFATLLLVELVLLWPL